MGKKTFFLINLVLSIFAFLINILAAIALWKKRPLKSFQIVLLNIVFCNAIYALNIMSSSVLFFTHLELLVSKKYSIFRNLKAELFAILISFFIVFMTLQRLIAAVKPLKYANYVTIAKTKFLSFIIYCTVATVLIVCSVLIWETNNIDLSKFDKAISCLFIIEAGLIMICYIVIIYKIRFSRFPRSNAFTRQNRRVLIVALIVSTSFLVSYTPISFVVLLEVKSLATFRIVIYMLWIDSFINPIAIIFNNNHISGSPKGAMRRKLSKKEPHQIKIGEGENVSHSYTNET